MIPLTEINRAVEKFEVPAETIEKDYVISWILYCLAKSKIKDDFMFYGGTAIKRMYFEEHRFSEDIDLISTSHFSQTELLDALKSLRYAREQANLVLDVDEDSIVATRGRIQLLIMYSGYGDIVGAPKQIRLDFSMGMWMFGNVAEIDMIKSYSDLKSQATNFSVMTLNTILANKLGLLVDSTRNEPRDLFDIWFLLLRRDKFDFDFSQVCDIFKQKYSFRPAANILFPCLQGKSLRQNWNMRLNEQVANLPDIEPVIEQTKTMLSDLFADER